MDLSILNPIRYFSTHSQTRNEGASSADQLKPTGIEHNAQKEANTNVKLSKSFPAQFNLSDLNGQNGFVLNGVEAGDQSGYSVSTAGDINGDGIDDMVVGASGAPGGNGPGASYVIFGRNTSWPASMDLSNLNGTNGFVLKGVAAGDQLGFFVSTAGDINGDSIDDIIVGAVGAPHGTGVGASYVVFGRNTSWSSSMDLSSLNGTNGFVLKGVGVQDYTGYSVSTAGDINGDSIDDVIVGAIDVPHGTEIEAGAGYMVFGRNTSWPASMDLSSLNGTNGFVLKGVGVQDYTGYSVSAAGDINDDGIDDVVVGATGAPHGTEVGASYVVFGRNTSWPASMDLSSLNGTNGFVLKGVSAGDLSGSSVSAAGDINGDGIDDVIVGAMSANNSVGASYVVFGSSLPWPASMDLSSLNGTNGFVLNGVNMGDNSGCSVSTAGDINGDGIDDVIVGASAAPMLINVGASYVVFGNTLPWPASMDLSSLNGTNGFVLNGVAAGDRLGYSVSATGDINGDGIDDVIVGAPYAPGGSGLGGSYIVFGRQPSPPLGTTIILGIIGGGLVGIIAIGLLTYAAYHCIQRNRRKQAEFKNHFIYAQPIQGKLEDFVKNLQKLEGCLNDLKQANNDKRQIEFWMHETISLHKKHAESLLGQEKIKRKELKILIKDVQAFVKDFQQLNLVENSSSLDSLKDSLQTFLKHPALKKAKPEEDQAEESTNAVTTTPAEKSPLLVENYV